LVTSASHINSILEQDALSHEDVLVLKSTIAAYPLFIAPKIKLLHWQKEHEHNVYQQNLERIALQAPDRAHLYAALNKSIVRKIVEEVLEDITTIDNTSRSSKLTTEVPHKEVTETLDHPLNENSSSNQNKIIIPDDYSSETSRIIEDNVEKLMDSPLQEANLISSEDSKNLKASNLTDQLSVEINDRTDDVLDLLLREAYTPGYSIEKAFPETHETHLNDNTTNLTDLKNVVYTPIERTFLDWLDEVKTSNNQDLPERTSDDLIDSFITHQPRIGSIELLTQEGDRVFTDDEHPRSKDLNRMVTETLARIYLKQKNYDRAIKVYKQLILNIPEKKGYFASQIHFLSELIKKN